MHWVRTWGAALAASAALMAVCDAARAQDPVGEWHGTMTNGEATYRMGVTISAKPSGGYIGYLTSPDQNGAKFALDEVTVKDGTLTFYSANIKGYFSGHWDALREGWVGKWDQGVKAALTLSRGKP